MQNLPPVTHGASPNLHKTLVMCLVDSGESRIMQNTKE